MTHNQQVVRSVPICLTLTAPDGCPLAWLTLSYIYVCLCVMVDSAVYTVCVCTTCMIDSALYLCLLDVCNTCMVDCAVEKCKSLWLSKSA